MTTTATKTAKQIINSLNFLTKEQKEYILQNKISHLPMQIEITEDKHKFIFITNFAHIEQIEIDANDFRIWEHFSMMIDLKTALNFWTYISEGKKITHNLLDKQKNVTPKKSPTANGFMEFLNGLTPEAKTHLKTEILRWDTENLMQDLKPYLESYQKNEGDKFKTGEYILYFDELQNASFYGRIFQAENNGLIMINTADAHLIADNRMKLEHIPAEKIPAHFKKPIDQIFEDYSETGDEFRDKFFTKLEKETERKEKADRKAEAEADKKFTNGILKASKIGMLPEGTEKNKEKYLFEGKYLTITQLKKHFETLENLETLQADFIRAQDEKTENAYKTLGSTKLTTPAEIEDFLKMANQYNWSKKQKSVLNDMVKVAKEKIKADLKNKSTETKPDAEPKTEEAKQPETAILAKTTARRKPAPKKDDQKQENTPEEPKG